MGIIVQSTERSVMYFAVAICVLLGAAHSSPLGEQRFSCQECVHEMHDLGFMIHVAAPDIEQYLADNYCPTLEDHPQCEEDMTHAYMVLLGAIVHNYFIDGALHMCQTGGLCDVYAREYTCDECVQGLEWVEMYLEDPIQVAEYALYLMQNVCLDDRCRDLVANHWPAMHWMAMEKFMIPQEICNQEPVCTGEPDWTRPPQ